MPIAVAGLLAAAAPTASHPGHGYLAVSIRDLSFNPRTVEAVQGDTVMWFWDGPDRNHSVTADPDQSELFDSDPDGPPDQNTHKPSEGFPHRFTQVGSFTYHCKVHPTMRGTVNVAPQAGGPPPPDTTAPSLSAVVAKPSRLCTQRSRRCKRKGTVLEFTLGEKADLVIAVRKRRGKRAYGRVVDAIEPRGKVGLNRVKLAGGRLGPGSYRLTVVATDVAGNSSRARRVDISIRR